MPYDQGEAKKKSQTHMPLIGFCYHTSHNAHTQVLMDFRALSKDLNIYITSSLDFAAAG